MNDNDAMRMKRDVYEDAHEGPLRDMLATFYSRRLSSAALLVWIMALLFLAAAVYCGVKFFDATGTKAQIMYAALFVCFFSGVSTMKIFAWQMVHRYSITRQIRRLELRVNELAEGIGH